MYSQKSSSSVKDNMIDYYLTTWDPEKYVIKANLCRALSKELGLPENTYTYEETRNYEPPKEHGLSNSNVIIPSYYHLDKHPSKIFDIDYLVMIKDDIRNLRELNKYQLEYIKQLSHEEKNEILDIFNECVKSLIEIVNK